MIIPVYQTNSNLKSCYFLFIYCLFVKMANCSLSIAHPILPVYLLLSVLAKNLPLLLNMLLIYPHININHFHVLSPMVSSMCILYFFQILFPAKCPEDINIFLVIYNYFIYKCFCHFP